MEPFDVREYLVYINSSLTINTMAGVIIIKYYTALWYSTTAAAVYSSNNKERVG